MNALEFIKNDLKKQREMTSLSLLNLFMALIVLSLFLGFGMRDDFGRGLNFNSVLSAILGYTILLCGLKLILKNVFNQQLVAGLLLLSFLFSIQTALLNPSTIYATSDIFWSETAKCFYKGCFSTILVGLVLTLFSFKYASWPNRWARFLLASVAGLSGAFMLEIHCDSASLTHVFSGHILQGILSGTVIFLLTEIIFVKGIKSFFPALKSFRNINRL